MGGFQNFPQFFSSIPEEESPKKGKADENKEEDAKNTENPAPVGKTEVGLTVSSRLPLEAFSIRTGSVYTCQKSFRAEKSDTNKHLAAEMNTRNTLSLSTICSIKQSVTSNMLLRL